ncbi:MAG: hypothetical protein Q4C70_09485 [Planctomycetia bacterium]|nr:hypothetical protein [Planctomycetia bacterium]
MLNMELYAYACDWQVILKEISENQEDENFLKTPKLQETCKTLLDETETCLNQFVETKTPYIWGLEQLIFSGRIVYSVLPERSAGYRETVAQFLTLYPIPDYERMDAETMRKHILDDWFPK